MSDPKLKLHLLSELSKESLEAWIEEIVKQEAESSRDSKYKDVEGYMKHSTFKDDYPFIFLHPDQTRKKYNPKELLAFKICGSTDNDDSAEGATVGSESKEENDKTQSQPEQPSQPQDNNNEKTNNQTNNPKRNFEVGLFLSEHVSQNIKPVESVFLQTYFSDNHKHTSNWNYIRDLLKSVVATKNYTSARSTLTQLLSAGFLSEESAYCSFAISVASALSNDGERTNFGLLNESESHVSRPMVLDGTSDEDVKLARRQLCALMDIVFSKMKVHRYLLKENAINIYRLGHCRYTIAESPIGCIMSSMDTIFCFALQCSLAIYVGLEMGTIFSQVSSSSSSNEENGDKTTTTTTQWNNNNLALAIIALFYSGVVFLKELQNTRTAVEIVFHKTNIFWFADIFVNVVLHFFLLIAGFVVIYDQVSYIDAVLNVAALLFIIEMDDTLVGLLGSNTEKAVNNFLIKRSMNQLDRLVNNSPLFKDDDEEDENSKHNLVDSIRGMFDNDPSGIQRKKLDFSDYYLTNYPEQGSDPVKGDIFQPFAIKKHNEGSFTISPSCVVTAQCLIKEITWWYTSWGENDGTEPRIGKLKIKCIKGNKEVTINPEREKKMKDNVKLQKEPHSLKGVYIITIFQMSVDVLRLRLCGSKTAEHFKEAFEHYSLWDIDSYASKVLDNYDKEQSNILG